MGAIAFAVGIVMFVPCRGAADDDCPPYLAVENKKIQADIDVRVEGLKRFFVGGDLETALARESLAVYDAGGDISPNMIRYTMAAMLCRLVVKDSSLSPERKSEVVQELLAFAKGAEEATKIEEALLSHRKVLIHYTPFTYGNATKMERATILLRKRGIDVRPPEPKPDRGYPKTRLVYAPNGLRMDVAEAIVKVLAPLGENFEAAPLLPVPKGWGSYDAIVYIVDP